MTTIRALTLALLASVGFVDSRATHFESKRNDTVITDDTYFYGQSPPVYPAPTGKGTGDWAVAYEKAAALVAQMTLEEKTNMTGGRTTVTGCSGEIQPVERLGFPGMCLSDAGNGVRGTDFVNAYASGLSVGASWNRDLAYQRGAHMGTEFRKKGVNVALGPVVGPLGRVVESGRRWEGSSSDPYLAGSLAAETVKGTQGAGVITSLKHFVGNEQELRRNPITDDDENVIGGSVSSNMDDKTMHELYLWAFMEPIRAGTGNVMCSYNRLNNSHSCGNSAALNGLLKTELGFQGFVVSDWLAQHSGVSTALAGLDMVMPLGSAFWGTNLTEAVTNGSVSVSRLDDMATRVLASWYQMGQDEGFPELGVGMPIDLMAPHEIVNARDPASKQVLFDGAVEGHVLVKNVNNALPLKSPQLVSVFGYSAYTPMTANPGGGSMSAWTLGYEATNVEAAYNGFGIADAPIMPLPNVAINGTIISGGGSGANNPAYISSPLEALSQQAYEDNTSLVWDFTNTNGTAYVDGASDVCLVFINAFASEGFDRPAVHDDYSDNLVINIANQCNNTMVVIHNAGVYLVDAFVDHPNITAILYAHVPGQDSGRATTSILYGNSVPSGKLPYTVAKNESDYGSLLSHTVGEGEYSFYPQSDFTEGVYIDYRAFDAQNMTPRYEFGFGLSYTTFSYSNIAVTQLSNVSTAAYPVGDVVQGGADDLWDVLATVTADITNTGSFNGSEVAQLYVNVPGGPVRQLRGYSKVPVTSGATESVSFDITRRDLSEWDVAAQKWHLQSGSYDVSVGASSRNLPLTSTIVI